MTSSQVCTLEKDERTRRKIQSKAPFALWCLGVCTWANRADFLKNSRRGRKDDDLGGVRVLPRLWYSNSVPLWVSHCQDPTTSTHGDGHHPAVTAGWKVAAQTLRRWDPIDPLTYRLVSPRVSTTCPPCGSLLSCYFVRSSIFIISSDHLIFPALCSFMWLFICVQFPLLSCSSMQILLPYKHE